MAVSYLKTYFKVLLIIFLIVGVINTLVDPLWYGAGNRLTGVNPPWNERITKTNLLLQHSSQDYDCVLFGTSRSTLLDTSLLTNHRCFNYSFSGGDPEEFVNYAEYIKQKGFNPQQIFVEIDPENLNERTKPKVYEEVTDPIPVYQAYILSLDVLRLSFRTLTNQHSFARLYDRHFRGTVSNEAPEYEPEFEREERKTCDLSRVRPYEELKQVFPDANFVGFIAPVSVWYVFNTRYSAGLLDCQLAGIHQISQLFDTVYDFSVPSPTTTRTNNTYDGNHYYPEVYEKVAAVLNGQDSDFGIPVDQFDPAEYQSRYATRLQKFLDRVATR